ncbi:CCCH zinc finger domain-containing protein [Dioscorea alata]|uniref:CCCH zinc finger domain-containing protein n=1 Tax=Dioscorea alata TaxID=55571 RepID=A0ACB7UX71_DIOAL|nr:CCCH zinc finger domain-containing protein [Dioscorea alata]
MEISSCTKIILGRLQKLEPENAQRIMGYLLLSHTQEEMIDYAIGPDSQIHELINEAKACLASSVNVAASSPTQPHNHSIPGQYVPFSSTVSRPFSSSSSLQVAAPSPLWDAYIASEQQQEVAMPNLVLAHPSSVDFSIEDQPEYSSNYLYQDAALACSLGPRSGLRLASGLHEYPLKPCHYYYKGFCRNGNNCRYFHGREISDGFSLSNELDINETVNEDHAFGSGSLEKLELEIRELLLSRNGVPISIASLPLLYQEKYGRPLQADGYLTESQRHRKAGYSLTKLLGRLKNGIRLVDRAHGQHSVVLTEDALRYMDLRNERNELLEATAPSCQIYLTFPADSTFNEEDVLKYFNKFGPVRDVRIPRQEKRMFGFVSFMYPETVKLIFSKGFPHFICGSRILVKPYKEKPKLNDRQRGLWREWSIIQCTILLILLNQMSSLPTLILYQYYLVNQDSIHG